MFGRKKHPVKQWRAKARLIDPHKTKLIIESAKKAAHVPPWMIKSLASCSYCGGTGIDPETMNLCPDCKGKGRA